MTAQRLPQCPELVSKVVTQTSFLSEITPCLAGALQPMIESTVKSVISSSLAEIRSELVDPLIKDRDSIIESLNKKLDEKDEKIEALSTEVVSLQTTVNSLVHEVSELKMDLNDLEQYGRRTNIQMSNVKLDNPGQCEEKVLDICNKILPSDSPLTSHDIERCHPLGRPNKLGNRQVIVKFKSIRSKQAVYANKSRLKNLNERIYISEDLTRLNQELVRSLRNLHQNKELFNYWTIDGKIFCRKSENSQKVRIFKDSDINTL